MYPPCKNPNCKSYGKPHPNCRCYGLAEGGEVGNFCDNGNAHEEGCDLHLPDHGDPQTSAAAYISHAGLHGLIGLGSKDPEDELTKFSSSINSGHKMVKKHVESLFGGPRQEPPDHTRSKKIVNDWIDKGGITHDVQSEIYKQMQPQSFANGGSVMPAHKGVHNDSISTAYPEQNVQLQAAKGRMSAYLNGLKPQEHQPKLAFDRTPDDREQKKSYNKALNLAVHPLGILDEIKRGTITPEHVAHFEALHPDVNEALQKSLTERITKAQLSSQAPSHKVRQGLSLFMGTALSGEFMPQNMQAVQAVFANKKQQTQQQPQRKTSALKEADQSYLTPNQAAAERQQKQ